MNNSNKSFERLLKYYLEILKPRYEKNPENINTSYFHNIERRLDPKEEEFISEEEMAI